MEEQGYHVTPPPPHLRLNNIQWSLKTSQRAMPIDGLCIPSMVVVVGGGGGMMEIINSLFFPRWGTKECQGEAHGWKQTEG